MSHGVIIDSIKETSFGEPLEQVEVFNNSEFALGKNQKGEWFCGVIIEGRLDWEVCFGTEQQARSYASYQLTK